MARAAEALGYEYLAITDHSKALAMANGLDERRALAHAKAIREVGRRLEHVTVLAGIECDIRPDGSLDLADDCLAQLDLVIASVHSGFNQDEAQMTERVLAALDNPWVDVLGHPTGRLLLRRDPYRLDVECVSQAAADAGEFTKFLPRGGDRQRYIHSIRRYPSTPAILILIFSTLICSSAILQQKN